METGYRTGKVSGRAARYGAACSRNSPRSIRPWSRSATSISGYVAAKGARITEVGMLGLVALRLQKPIEWDAASRRVVGIPAAAALIDPKPRPQFLPHG